MKITTTARHYELTPALRDYAEKKVMNLKKYFNQIVNAHITFSLEKYRHAVEISVHVNGKHFNSKEESEDMYASVDRVVDKLERQILRHKGKIRRPKSYQKISEMEYSFPDEKDGDGEQAASGGNDFVLLGQGDFPESTLKEAVDAMKKDGKEYNVFNNIATRKLNVIFLMENGKVGLIEVG